MKALLPCLIIALLPVCALAQKQAERFREVRTVYGDKLYEAVYFLPETKDTVRKHIPNLDQWIGFEVNFWKKIPEETKLKILDELGAQADALKDGGADRLWRRIQDWVNIDAQLNLLSTFSDADEGFMDIVFEDKLLRPTFDWLLKRRPKDFDTKHIGSTFSSGEMAGFYPMLVERLLDSSKLERYECFARLFTRLAKDASPSAPASSVPEKAKPDPS
ncbi:MAG: hypothetical protein ACAH88_05725 [Roseimicrobium sp.]